MSTHSLIDEPPLMVSPTLACALGINEALFLQQIHFWIVTKQREPERNSDAFHDGKWWIYNTIPQWRKQLPFISNRTMIRVIVDLRATGILLTMTMESTGLTNWYTIDYDCLSAKLALIKVPNWHDNSCQPVTNKGAKLARNKGAKLAPTYKEQRIHITETSTESSYREEKDAKQSEQSEEDPLRETARRMALLYIRTWEARYNSPALTNASALHSAFHSKLKDHAENLPEADFEAAIRYYLADTNNPFWKRAQHAHRPMLADLGKILVTIREAQQTPLQTAESENIIGTSNAKQRDYDYSAIAAREAAIDGKLSEEFSVNG